MSRLGETDGMRGGRQGTRGKSVCMVAYANYFTDARIKNYVSALLEDGYEVDVFALGRPGPGRPGLRVHCVLQKAWSTKALPYLLSQVWFFLVVGTYLSLLALRRRYALVHAHNIPDFLVFTALVPKLRGAAVVLDVHDTMPEAMATKFGLELSHPLIGLVRFEERLSARFADFVLTTNDLHKEALVAHGIPESKVGIVMNVGHPAIFRPRTKREGGGALVLAYHGTIAARLGVDLVVRAVALALDRCPELRLLLVGEGEYLPEVARLIGELGIDGAVTRHGWVDVERLPDLLADADAGVIGNRAETEAKQNWMLPVKMLEYAAMEIPTIAPRLRAIERYFDDESAVLYRPDDIEDLARRIRELYGDRSLLDRRREGLRDFNRRYNWDRMQREYLDLVAGLSGGRVA